MANMLKLNLLQHDRHINLILLGNSMKLLVEKDKPYMKDCKSGQMGLLYAAWKACWYTSNLCGYKMLPAVELACTMTRLLAWYKIDAP